MCWEIGTPNLDTDFWEAVPKLCDTTSSVDPIFTLHQEDFHLDINMKDQLYMGAQLFIHHNLVQYKTHLHFLCGYPIMTLLHYMATFPSPTWDLLCQGMAREEGRNPIYSTPWVMILPCVYLLHTSLQNI